MIETLSIILFIIGIYVILKFVLKMSAITILAVLKGIFMSIRYPLIGLFIIASVIFIVVFYFNYGIGGLLFASAIIGIVLATLKKFFNSYRF